MKLSLLDSIGNNPQISPISVLVKRMLNIAAIPILGKNQEKTPCLCVSAANILFIVLLTSTDFADYADWRIFKRKICENLCKTTIFITDKV